MRRTPALGVAAALALSVGCGRFGRRDGPPPERFLAADARVAAVVPRLDDAIPQVAALLETAAGFPGAGELTEWRASATAQLGFDPLDRRGLAGAGIDATRGAAVASYERAGGRTALLVLPVKDPDAFGDLVARLARDRLGAGVRGRERRGTLEVEVFRRGPKGPAALAYALVDATAIVAGGATGPEEVAAAAALPSAASLAESAPWKAARRALGEGHAALGFAPARSPLLSGFSAVRDGVAVGLSGGPGRLCLTAALLLGGDREPSFRTLAGKGAADAAHLDPAAALAGAWHGDPAALAKKLVAFLTPRDRARLQALGVDAQSIADLLAPGAAFSVSLAPGLDIASLSEARVRADPLRLVQFEAVAAVRDPERARAVSQRIAAAARRPPRKNEVPQGSWQIATPSGQIAWRVDGTRLAVAGGAPGRLDALEARLEASEGFHAPTRDAAAALESGLGGVVVHVPRLVASVRGLPDDSYGTGPNAFVMRSVVDRIIAPADRLEALSLRADLAEGALVLALTVETRGGRGAP